MTNEPYDRTRTRVPLNTAYEDVNQVSSTLGDLGTVRTDLVQESLDVMHDVVTPGWRKKIAAGVIVDNPCSYVSYTYEHLGGSSQYVSWDSDPTGLWDSYNGGNWTRIMLARGAGERDSLSEDTGLKDSKVRALANIDSTPYAFGEDLLEIGETIRFLKSPFKSMAQLSDVVRSTAATRSLEDGLSLAKAMADAWSTYRFAFMPLIRSAIDVVDAASQQDRTRPERLTSRGFAEYSDEVSGQATFGTENVDGHRFDYNVTTDSKHHAYILYKVTNPVENLRFRLGLRNKDIPHTLWQILPLSFMVDRVVDISTSVQAFMNLADPSVKILNSGTTLHKTHIETNACVERWKPGKTFAIDGGTTVSTTFTYSRSKWNPSISDIKPPIHPGDLVKDIQSIVDLAAIIIQRLGIKP